jgi:acyl-CoA synthetase (AMP-forming)/AMP-acid ligase II/acyl carrier protein
VSTSYFDWVGTWNKNKNIFCLHDGGEYTYEHLLRDAQVIGRQFGSKKQIISLSGPQNLEYIKAYFAVMLSGNVLNLQGNRETETNLWENYRIDTYDNTLTIERTNDRQFRINKELAMLIQTSGTSNSPKTVMLSHENLISNAKAIAEYLQIVQSDRAPLNLPIEHGYGMSVLNSHFISGASVILKSNYDLSSGFWLEMDEMGMTNFNAVPFHYERLSKNLEYLAHAANLRFCTQAGGKLNTRVINEISEIFRKSGKRFYVMYGQTEASPRMTYLPFSLVPSNSESIGVAIPGGKIWLEDSDGIEIKLTGVEGELIYTGPNVMLGYLKEEKDLHDIEKRAPLRTGDIGKFNSNNLIEVVGRVDRQIKFLGNRLNLEEVESQLKGNSRANVYLRFETSINRFSVFTDDLKAVMKNLETVNILNLDKNFFRVYELNKWPLSSSGKTDFVRLRRLMDYRTSSKPFMSRLYSNILTNLFFTRSTKTINEIFVSVFVTKKIQDSSTFRGLGGDSLDSVSLLVLVENHFHCDLPRDWMDMSVAQLAKILKGSDL